MYLEIRDKLQFEKFFYNSLKIEEIVHIKKYMKISKIVHFLDDIVIKQLNFYIFNEFKSKLWEGLKKNKKN